MKAEMELPAGTAGLTQRMVSMLRVLANPSRLAILQCLQEAEHSVAELDAALGIGQPNLSQQLAELRAAGTVLNRRDGRTIWYRLRDQSVRELIEQVRRVALDDAPAACNKDVLISKHIAGPAR